MKYGLYAIRDVKVGFMSVMTDNNDSTAIRNFEHACSNVQSVFYTHPSDYSLYKIGVYDSDSGVIESLSPVQFICDAPLRKE